MKVLQNSLSEDNWKEKIETILIDANLFLVFVSKSFKLKNEVLAFLNIKFPNSTIIGCSTGGEISDVTVKDNTISLTAIQLEKTEIKKVSYQINDVNCSYKAGEEIASGLDSENLKHVFILSDGVHVNGSDLVSGLKTKIPNVSITGGLASDATGLMETFVINGDKILDKHIVAVGFYGNNLKVGYGSKGGWDSFGIERLVTKSDKNVIYELDGQPVLDIYEKFLGTQAVNLRNARLLFPFSMRNSESTRPIVRTVLRFNEEEKSLTFAGNIPKNSCVRFMKPNIDRLINGAEDSAIAASKNFKDEAELAILISCSGRRFILKQLVEEELEAVRAVIGYGSCITGFYSNGEIAPFDQFLPCHLHNQTMTITILSEC